MQGFSAPDLLRASRRVPRDVRRFLVRWSAQALAVLLVVAIGLVNLALLLTSAPRQTARAAVASFSEDFATTTYRDTANTTATWLGDGTGYLGYGAVSSTRYFFENPPTGAKGFKAISCKDGSTCFMAPNVISVLRTTDGGSTWEVTYNGYLDVQHTASGSALNDVHAIPGTNTVYAAGEENNAGLVIKSTDGGSTWTEVNTGFSGTNEFQDIQCADANTCVVVNGETSGTRIWYTTDGGSNWSAATTPAGSYALRGLDFVTGAGSSTWRAVGTLGTVLVSAATSTPQGWTQETPFTGEELRDVEHLSSGAIHVVGGTTHTTSFMASSTNAGSTYATSTHPGTSWIYGIDCGDADTCWTAGGDNAGGVPETMRTDNAGNTWTVVTSNAPNLTAGGYLRDVAATDGSTAYAAGGGGSTWALVKTSTSTHFTDIARNALCTYDTSGCTSDANSLPIRGMWMDPSDGQRIYVAGEGATSAIGTSADGGESWAYPTSFNPGQANAIDCATSQVCFIGGTAGFLAKTTNGATSWTTQTQTSVFDANATDVDVTTTQVSWVIGTSGSAGKPKIVRSTDGGTTYTAATGSLASTFSPQSLLAVSTSTAWVGGQASGGVAKIYYTTDGGANWTEQFTNSSPGGNIVDLFCLPNLQECWGLWTDSAGDDNIVKTTNGGSSWTELTDVLVAGSSVFYGIWFLNSSIGFAAVDSCTGVGDTLRVTTNGGSSWSRIPFFCMDGAIAFEKNRGVIGGASSAGLFAQLGRIVYPFATSTLQSTTIDSVSGEVTCAGITPTQTLNGGTVTYQMSNDGGATWTSSGGSCADFSHTHEFAFASTGSDLRWRATLTGQESSPPTTTPEIESLSIDYSYNTPPNTPSNVSPSNGATEVLLTPTLTASDFSDPDAGNTHASSRWEVSAVAGDFTAPVYATTSTTNLESITIPSGVLTNSATYYWRVKYVDNVGANSAFSTSTSFTTLGASSASTVAQSTPPTSPIALPFSTERGVEGIVWHFQDTAATEQGFSIIDALSGTTYATTNPIFTQDISRLTEDELSPATRHCNRAVVAFNDKGNSPITASSTYPCTWTLPADPGAPIVATTSPTTVTLAGIPPDANPPDVTYEICETTTGQCLAPGEEGYVLSSDALRQTREEWGAAVALGGLHPVTTYAFALTAFSANGDAASGTATVATTLAAPVAFSIAKSVAVNPMQAALAGIAFAADFSVAALALMAIAGTVWFLAMHRRSGPVRCVAGLSRIFRHHGRSYAAVVGDGQHGPPAARHARVHGFLQGTLSAALVTLLLKGTLVGITLFAPGHALGQGDFSGDGQIVFPGDTLVYQISLRNLGPGEATSVTLEDAVPAGASYTAGSLTVDGSGRTDACDADGICIDGGTVRLTRATLGVGASTLVTFAVRVTGGAGQTVANSACTVSAELTTPTCSESTANPIGQRPPPAVNENRNANVPPPVPRPAPAPGEVGAPAAPEGPAPEGEAPAAEQPPAPASPPETAIRINGAPPSAEQPINDPTPTVAGRGEPGTLVTIAVDGTLAGAVFVEQDGAWRLTLREPLADGVHTVAVLVDGAERDRAVFAIDATAPAAPADLSVRIERLALRDATIAVSARTGPDVRRVRIRVESDPIEVEFAPPGERWTREITGRFDPGGHTVTVVAYDGAGNASAPASASFTVPAPGLLAAPLAVLDDPLVEQVSQSVVAPAVVAVAAANVAVAAGIPTLFNFLGLLFTQPALLFARRERKGYGTVYNSLSKLPLDLAIVRIREEGTARIVQTKVTDRLGRYVFFLKPGRYAIEVTKPGFVHPSRYVSAATGDPAYADVLTGVSAALPEAGSLAKSIPMDPVTREATPAAIRREALLRKVQYAVALSGPVVSLATVAIAPNVIVIVFAAFQLATFALFRRLAYKKPPKSMGVVRDAATGRPLAGVVVRVFETAYQKLLEAQVTDTRGRYAFLVGPNRYYVTASLPGYATRQTAALDFSAAVKGAVVAVDLDLDRIMA